MGGVVIIARPVLGLLPGQADHPERCRRRPRCCCSSCSSGWALVGFLDDFIKISKQRSLGLRSKAKIVGQTVIALVFGWLALSPALEDDRGVSPGVPTTSPSSATSTFALPTVVAILLIWVMITGTSNAVNLTDGLDGLATGAS